jgi:hypothetical protein
MWKNTIFYSLIGINQFNVIHIATYNYLYNNCKINRNLFLLSKLL